ncbi:MAG: hypothetical protein ACR2J4_05005 [Deinococcus sp.]
MPSQDDQTEAQRSGQDREAEDLEILSSGMAEVRTGDAGKVEEQETGEAHPADPSAQDR